MVPLILFSVIEEKKYKKPRTNTIILNPEIPFFLGILCIDKARDLNNIYSRIKMIRFR